VFERMKAAALRDVQYPMVGGAAAPTKLVGFADPLNPPYGYYYV
jgi:hypothetical protein